jgi:hypothetical protein
VFFHQLGRVPREFEFAAIAIKMQNALRPLVVMNAFPRADFLQPRPAFHRELDDLGRVAIGVPRQTLDQKARDPEPLMYVELRPEQQRGFIIEKPFQDFRRRRRIGPRLRMADRNLPAIGKTRLQPRLRLAIDDAHRLPAAREPIGGGDADDAGAKDNRVEILNG